MVLVSSCIMMVEHMRIEVSFFMLLQLNVKNAVESFAGLENITVNVFVDGIEIDKAESDEAKEK